MNRNKRIKQILTKKFLKKTYLLQKKPTLQIAKETKICKRTILDYLVKFNINRRTVSEAKKDKKRSYSSRKKQSETLKNNSKYWKKLKYGFGEKNGNWKGGLSFIPYPLGWNKTFREQIRYRDGYKCQICGVPEIECKTKLHVHHIDYDKNNLKIENLISLCISCHLKTNGNRNYWQEIFINDTTH